MRANFLRPCLAACQARDENRGSLGVDPLYSWTGRTPTRRTEVVVSENYAHTEGARFHYRGWFLNDEDLLTGWTPGVPQDAGIALVTSDHIFEAILPLKGNMVVPGR